MPQPLILVVTDYALRIYAGFLKEKLRCEPLHLNTKEALEIAEKRGDDVSLVVTSMYLDHGPELDMERSQEGFLTGRALKEKLEPLCPRAKFMIFYDSDPWNGPVVEELKKCPNVIIPGSFFQFPPSKFLEEVKKVLK